MRFLGSANPCNTDSAVVACRVCRVYQPIRSICVQAGRVSQDGQVAVHIWSVNYGSCGVAASTFHPLAFAATEQPRPMRRVTSSLVGQIRPLRFKVRKRIGHPDRRVKEPWP